MANEASRQRRRWIDCVKSRVKRCHRVKDRSRLWKVGVRDRVRDLCSSIMPGSSFPLAAYNLIEINSIMPAHAPVSREVFAQSGGACTLVHPMACMTIRRRAEHHCGAPPGHGRGIPMTEDGIRTCRMEKYKLARLFHAFVDARHS